MKNLILNLFLFLIFLLFSCNEKKTNNGIEKTPPEINLFEIKGKLYDIKGFYFFKRNMSFDEVTNILKEKKIKFKILNLTNREEINFPLSYHYQISVGDLIRVNNIKIIEGYNLPILQTKISRFQICFFDKKIFYVNYNNYFDNYQSSYDGNEKINGDIELLKILSEGLRFKYGSPNVSYGNLNSFFPPNPNIFNWNTGTSKGSQVTEEEIWIGKDKSHIRLLNWNSRDTLNFEPLSVRTQIGTTIEVLLEPKFANEIFTINEREDSIKNIKRKKNNDLKKKKKLEEFEKL
jgi:hypothetical protein